MSILKRTTLILCGVKLLNSLEYPWGDYATSMSKLLDKLRDKMELVMFEDTLPTSLSQNDGKWAMTDNYLLRVQPQPVVIPFEYGNEDSISKILAGTCDCVIVDFVDDRVIRKEVRQFHWHQGSDGAGRSPDWSLGVFNRSAVIREGGQMENSSAPIVKIIEYFSNGQHCDETHKGRESEVHLVCCDKVRIDQIAGNNAAVDTSANAPAWIASVKERQTCSYEIAVCVKAMCAFSVPGQQGPDTDDGDVVEDANEVVNSVSNDNRNNANDETLIALLEVIEPYDGLTTPSIINDHEYAASPGPQESSSASSSFSVASSSNSLLSTKKKKTAGVSISTFLRKMHHLKRCVVILDTWWHYEFCYHTGVRQFHVEPQARKQGDDTLVTVQTIVAEHNLGLPPVSLYSNDSALEDLVVKPSKPVITTKLGMSKFPVQIPILRLEFEGGSECDLLAVEGAPARRGSAVELRCAPRESMSVVEDRTCHYLFKVESVHLCKVDGFAPLARKTAILEFYNPNTTSAEISPQSPQLE